MSIALSSLTDALLPGASAAVLRSVIVRLVCVMDVRRRYAEGALLRYIHSLQPVVPDCTRVQLTSFLQKSFRANCANIIVLKCFDAIVNAPWRIGISLDRMCSLREEHAEHFLCICLYSDVCVVLADYRLSLATRRFVQELFQDVDFEPVGRPFRPSLSPPTRCSLQL